jgi:hypothetical protein
MSTIASRAHRLRSFAWLVAALIVSLALTNRPTHASRCPYAEPAAAATVVRQPADGSTGLDLEVKIWNVRIEFPWLKSLPVTPGRHIVLTLFESDAVRD